MYKDLPSRQLKCKVQDRAAIKTSEGETKVLQPVALQTVIDAVVAKYASGRALARPSGTEDAVRVYAEAETQTPDKLALEVSQAIFEHAGGIGKRPA
jgi:phosphoacetylglucosamine mutase